MEWGEYRLGDLFDASNGDFDIQKQHLSKEGDFVVTAGLSNSGVLGRSSVSAKIFDAGTLTVDMFGNAFYRYFPYKMVTHARVFSLKPKRALSTYEGLFISNSMHFLPSKFGYGNMCSWVKIKDELIQLPTRGGEIDYEFMERFIAELNAYLTITGLRDYELSEAERTCLARFERGETQWAEFQLAKVFYIKNAGNILGSDVVLGSGTTPYLCASRENNAVSGYISYKEELKNQGNCIFIGGKTFVLTYQEKDFYSNDSHNLIFQVKAEEHRTKFKQFYMLTCIEKGLSHKYS